MKYYTSTTEYNCGIDLHGRQMYICVMDRQADFLREWDYAGQSTGFSGSSRLIEAGLWDGPVLLAGPIPIESAWVFSRILSRGITSSH